MRPYLAVIYDSFVEAVSSKVLWVLLIAWTLILAGVAPFSFIRERSYEFSASEVLLRDQLVEKLEAAAKKKGTKSQQAVVAAMKQESQEYLAREKKQEGRPTRSGKIAEMLNEALQSKDLYSAEAWPSAEKRTELKELLERPADKLSKIEREHLNRRLIENAFQGSLKAVNENRVWVGYAGMKLGDSLIFSEKQSRMIVETIVLQGVMKLGLGVVAMFIAIIITSPMVPDMFQPGSLHLLLSKPISRSLLYLSKFVGGTIFVAINIAYLLVGLYFIAGLRLDIWNSGLLLCIPLFVFIFMIFYSVSALTGLIWKNAIVSVVVTGIFWLICFVIGVAYGVMKPFVDTLPQIVELRPVGDQIFAVKQEGALTLWDPKAKSWQTAYDSGRGGGNNRLIGPFWFEDKGELYFGRTVQNPFGIDVDNVRMSVASLPELRREGISDSGGAKADVAKTEKDNTGEGKTNEENANEADTDEADKEKTKGGESSKSDLWSDKRIDLAPNLPVRTRRVIPFKNTILVLTDIGLFQLDRDRVGVKQESTGGVGDMIRDAFSKFAPKKSTSAFNQVTPDAWQPSPPMDFAASPDEKTLGVYHRGQLEILQEGDQGKWSANHVTDLFEKKDELALLALNQEYWLVVGNDRVPRFGKIGSDEEPRMLEEIGEVTPRKVVVSLKDESFAILTADGDIWFVDRDGKSVRKPNLEGQGEASAVQFNAEGKLLVAHHVNRVDRWDLAAMKSDLLAKPNPRMVDRVFQWGVWPVYWLNPKPSAVDETIQYCLQREESVGFAFDTNGLSNARQKIDPWQPIWSNSIFIAVMLVLGCLYLHRQDL